MCQCGGRRLERRAGMWMTWVGKKVGEPAESCPNSSTNPSMLGPLSILIVREGGKDYRERNYINVVHDGLRCTKNSQVAAERFSTLQDSNPRCLWHFQTTWPLNYRYKFMVLQNKWYMNHQTRQLEPIRLLLDFHLRISQVENLAQTRYSWYT